MPFSFSFFFFLRLNHIFDVNNNLFPETQRNLSPFKSLIIPSVVTCHGSGNLSYFFFFCDTQEKGKRGSTMEESQKEEKVVDFPPGFSPQPKMRTVTCSPVSSSTENCRKRKRKPTQYPGFETLASIRPRLPPQPHHSADSHSGNSFSFSFSLIFMKNNYEKDYLVGYIENINLSQGLLSR